ncbi:MAG TPA: hypothetical protein VFL51_01875 [Pseudolabrys sp.]|nr:hypothetical protein [Pseudolabrys sp.]
MTLTERREPVFDAAPHDRVAPEVRSAGIGPLKSASRVTRVISGAQMLSTLLAVPLGLASGYSIYRANFSPETTCQNLRAGIIAMLDKKVDAAMRHMLVRRDVEEFERSCGSVDPDATAAFKRLLAADRAPPAAAAPRAEVKPKDPQIAPKETQAKVKQAEPKPKEAEAKPAHKAEPHAVAAKPAPAKAVASHTDTPRIEARRGEPARPRAVGNAVQAEAPVSDTAWLSAVRDALVKKGDAEKNVGDDAALTRKDAGGEMPALAKAAAPAPLVAPPAAAISPPPPAAPIAVSPAPAPEFAPALPQARDIAERPPSPPAPIAQEQQPAADHPVPPAPVVTPPDAPAKRSGVGALISDIPFVGPMVDAVTGR